MTEQKLERCKICGQVAPCEWEIKSLSPEEPDLHFCRHGNFIGAACDKCKDEEAEEFQ